jgi:hypothetical protein
VQLDRKYGHAKITADFLLINTKPKPILERLKDKFGSH